jgi:hypothetical protein
MMAVSEGLKDATRRLYGVDWVEIEPVGHAPRERIRILVRAASSVNIDTFLENLHR